MRALRSSILLLTLTLLTLQPATATQPTPSAAAPLADSSWQPQATGDETPAESTVTFLADGTLQVTSACPDVAGTYTATDDGDVTIDLPADAIAGCDDDGANALFATLAAATGFSIEDYDQLAITGTGGTVETFSPVLLGITWQWVEFQSSNDILVTPEADATHSMLINADGTVEIETPCASGTGTGTFDEHAGFDVDLSGLDTSGCAEDSPTALLLRDIDFATSYVIRDGHLYVALPMDGGIHEFAPVYEPASGG